MAGIIHKDDPRHSAHKNALASEKKSADARAVAEKPAAENKSADEKKVNGEIIYAT